MMYDSNVNAGPASGTVTLFGAPFQISGTSAKQHDWAALTSAQFDYLHPFNDSIGIAAGVAANLVRYGSVTHFDYDGESFYVGPAFRDELFGQAYQLNTNFGGNIANLGYHLYSTSWGVSPLLLVPFRDDMIFKEQVKAQANVYHTLHTRSGPSIFGTTSVQWFYDGPGAYVEPKLLIGHEQAAADIYTDDQVGISVGIFQPIGWGLSFYTEPGVKEEYYDQQNFVFGTTRHDTIYTVVANLGYDTGFHGLQAALGYTLTFNNSNQTLYKYRRNQGTLQFSLPF
jgi:hypothetical protein